jgi:hypothetical protein
VAATRRFYLVILSILVVALAVTGVYLRQRAVAAAAAKCETPALPPPPAATPPPTPSRFELEAGCGTPAAPVQKK